ncbi:MAG: polysaccharide deacetylase family protein [Streptococcaceae bacterium]|jgi:peptidoglycan/xylan/chitin deacetylase (PgdA/CDA1 family)|nr:polysaccharide deacetylase family protein [Streptococcaceae bacterium]
MERRSRKKRREKTNQAKKVHKEAFEQIEPEEKIAVGPLPNNLNSTKKEVHSSNKHFDRRQLPEKSSYKKRRRNFSSLVMLLLLLVIIVTISYVMIARPFDRKNTITTSTIASKSSSALSSSTSPKVTKSWLNTSAENYLPTLMYHNISPDTPNGNFVTPTNLESTLQVLQTDAVYTVSSDEALKILTTNTKPANKMIWLTFDDGYQDFYVNAFPLLKKYKMHATSFVITGKVGQAGYLTTDEIKEMAKSGLVDFQSHTVNHVSLDTDDATQTSELQQSKAYLDKLLNQKTHVICYPSGSHNADTGSIGTNLGYDMGLLDPGRTYNGETATNSAAKGSEGLFKLSRYRTFTATDGTAVKSMIADDEAYNVSNTIK